MPRVTSPRTPAKPSRAKAETKPKKTAAPAKKAAAKKPANKTGTETRKNDKFFIADRDSSGIPSTRRRELDRVLGGAGGRSSGYGYGGGGRSSSGVGGRSSSGAGGRSSFGWSWRDSGNGGGGS